MTPFPGGLLFRRIAPGPVLTGKSSKLQSQGRKKTVGALLLKLSLAEKNSRIAKNENVLFCSFCVFFVFVIWPVDSKKGMCLWVGQYIFSREEPQTHMCFWAPGRNQKMCLSGFWGGLKSQSFFGSVPAWKSQFEVLKALA